MERQPSFEYLSSSLPQRRPNNLSCEKLGQCCDPDSVDCVSCDCGGVCGSDCDPDSIDCVPCDCGGVCGSDCGHSFDLKDLDPIYLCNKLCACSADCANRLPATPILFDVQHREKKGWSLLARQAISANVYIGDYTGTIVKCPPTEPSTRNYTLTIRESSSSGCLTTHIDASKRGTYLRFMNHSCKPNVKVVPMRDDYIYPRATCWTCADVKKGDELCISYGETLGQVECWCGSVSCRGFLPWEPLNSDTV